MARRISEDRRSKLRYQKNKILIAVEGKNKTEKIYFDNFDDGRKRYSISIAKGNDTDPVKLVISLVKEIAKRDLRLLDGDKAFCIFDTDTNPNKNKLINEAKRIADANGIIVITSSPCIELWFLLHYEYTTANLTNEDTLRRLRTYIPNYDKTTNIFPNIEKNVRTAIERAKKLEIYQKENNKKIGTIEANPSTEMYKIVEYLISNG